MKHLKTFGRLNEDDSVKDSEGNNLSIGDVIELERDGKQYQILFDGRPFLHPYPIDKVDKEKAMYFVDDPSLADELKKVKSFSDTDGGFVQENFDYSNTQYLASDIKKAWTNADDMQKDLDTFIGEIKAANGDEAALELLKVLDATVKMYANRTTQGLQMKG